MDGRKALEIKDPTSFAVVAKRTDRMVQDFEARRLPRGWAWFAALVGPVVTIFCLLLEPAPTNPDAAAPLWGSVLWLAFMVSLAGAAVRGVQRHRSALGWASIVGLLCVAMTVACPASGHHTGVGPWWFGQLGLSGAALTVAVAARFRFQRARATASAARSGI